IFPFDVIYEAILHLFIIIFSYIVHPFCALFHSNSTRFSEKLTISAINTKIKNDLFTIHLNHIYERTHILNTHII
ncbi:hypothetical protein L9F63_024007, partial [Diploptera punctata]